MLCRLTPKFFKLGSKYGIKTQLYAQGFSQRGVQQAYGRPFWEEIQGKFT